MNSQKSLTKFSLIIFVFNNEKRTIIPKIGAGKSIFSNFKVKVQKYKIAKIINKPVKKLNIFFITKIIIL